MAPRHLVLAGLLLLLVPIVVALFGWLWLPLGLFLLVAGSVLWAVKRYYLDSRMTRGRPDP